MTHEDFVTYEQAKKLKELGFDWECYKKYGIKPMSFGTNVTWYKTEWTDYPEGYLFDKEFTGHREEDFILAPTLYQCQKWLRKVKKISICVEEKIEKNITRSLISDEWHTTFSILGYYCRMSINQKPDGLITNTKIGAIRLTEYFVTYEEALSRGIDYYLNKLLKK